MSFYDSDEFVVTNDEGDREVAVEVDSFRSELEVNEDGNSELELDEVIDDGNSELELDEAIDDGSSEPDPESRRRSEAEEMDAESESEEDNNNIAGLEMPKRKVKEPSAVWKLAERVQGGAQCKICKKVFKCGQGNTTNIFSHIKSTHKDRPPTTGFPRNTFKKTFSSKSPTPFKTSLRNLKKKTL